MPIVSLIARPGALDPALVHSLRDAWGGGAVQWLAPDEAAEFAVPTLPDTLEETRTALADRADLNALPDDRPAIRLLLADMDSTMIGQECIDELAAEAGLGDAVSRITARAMNGELDFEAALTERVALLRDLPAGVIDAVIASRLSFTPGGATLVATMRARGATAVLVSGGFTAFTDHVATALGFDAHRANTLELAGDRLTGRVVPPILGREAKVAALEAHTAALGISDAQVLAVGDGANDLGMLQRAGMGVALHAKPAVQAECALRVNHGDLTALLFLQGLAKTDFVTAGPA